MSLLAGIKVLEISDGLVDFGGRMLAELGADVVAVQADEKRISERDLAWHHGKTRLDAGDRNAIVALAQRADIVLDGQRKGDRFDLAAALEGSPHVIHVRVNTLMGAGRAATDLTLMAQSSLMGVTGDPDRPPLRFPGEQAYVLTGIQAATAALMGLYARRRIGRGQSVDVSALQSVTLASYREAVMYEWTGRIGRRRGNMLVRGKSGVRQIWPARDGHVTWSMIDNPPMMRALVAVMVEEGVAGELAEIDWDNTLVADTPQETIDRWQEVVARFFLSHGKAQLGRWSLEKGWGLSVINTPAEVRNSEHLAARGLFVQVVDESTGKKASLPGPLFASSLKQVPPPRTLSAPRPASSLKRWSAR
jgi:crotonobetainyl-CoA:carnitine CoA-transferase CaiB-like acyl-CoA transferase